MKKANIDTSVPLWKLERYLLGELPDQEMESIRKQIESDTGLKNRLEDLKRQYAELEAVHLSGEMIQGIRNRLKTEKPAFSLWQLGLKNLKPAMGVLALLILIPFGVRMFRPPTVMEPAGLAQTRIKGMNPELHMFRKVKGGSQPLLSGALAGEGDLIQILYNAAGMEYGAIVSVDGAERTTYHLTENRNEAVKLAQGGPIPLDFSFELDNTPGIEKFFFITSHRPFALDTVLSPIISAADRTVTRTLKKNNFTVTTFTIIKECGL
ncbi:MAG: hypothetical protein ACLFVQ_10815 [Chitinispirillaceae bacterium]